MSSKDLPGVKKEEVKVEVEEGRILQISGERSREKAEIKSDKWHPIEQWQLPSPIPAAGECLNLVREEGLLQPHLNLVQRANSEAAMGPPCASLPSPRSPPGGQPSCVPPMSSFAPRAPSMSVSSSSIDEGIPLPDTSI